MKVQALQRLGSTHKHIRTGSMPTTNATEHDKLTTFAKKERTGKRKTGVKMKSDCSDAESGELAS